MYKITRDGETVAMTEAPSYVRRAENGCFTLCQEAEAAGIVHNGQVFHLLGRPFLRFTSMLIRSARSIMSTMTRRASSMVGSFRL